MNKTKSVNDIIKITYKEGGKNVKNENKEFLILTRSKKTIEYIFKTIDNFPNKYINLTSRIERTCFDMLEILHYYVVNYENETYRKKYLKEFIVKLYLLDDLVGFSYLHKLINEKKLKSICSYIIELRKMSYGLIKNEEK